MASQTLARSGHRWKNPKLNGLEDTLSGKVIDGNDRSGTILAKLKTRPASLLDLPCFATWQVHWHDYLHASTFFKSWKNIKNQALILKKWESTCHFLKQELLRTFWAKLLQTRTKHSWRKLKKFFDVTFMILNSNIAHKKMT